MTFEDFCALYVCFRDKKDDEMMQVTFYMCQIKPDDHQRRHDPSHDLTQHSQHGKACVDEEHFTRSDLQIVAQLISIPPPKVKELYVLAAYNPQYPVTFREFSMIYKQVKNHELFTWIPSIFESLNTHFMNLNAENEGKNYERRLTAQQNDITKIKLSGGEQTPEDGETDKSAKLTSLEVDNIREFYNRDLKNKPAQEVHQIFRRMFKDVKNVKLRKYIF